MKRLQVEVWVPRNQLPGKQHLPPSGSLIGGILPKLTSFPEKQRGKTVCSFNEPVFITVNINTVSSSLVLMHENNQRANSRSPLRHASHICSLYRRLHRLVLFSNDFIGVALISLFLGGGLLPQGFLHQPQSLAGCGLPSWFSLKSRWLKWYSLQRVTCWWLITQAAWDSNNTFAFPTGPSTHCVNSSPHLGR